MDERDDLPTTDRLKGQRIPYLQYFHDRFNPKFNYYLRPRDGKPFRWALYLAAFAYDKYSGLHPFVGRGYDTVSTSSLCDPTRLKADSESCFCGGCLLAAGLIDGQASSTCMFSRAATESLIFANFAVNSFYYCNLARLR